LQITITITRKYVINYTQLQLQL